MPPFGYVNLVGKTIIVQDDALPPAEWRLAATGELVTRLPRRTPQFGQLDAILSIDPVRVLVAWYEGWTSTQHAYGVVTDEVLCSALFADSLEEAHRLYCVAPPPPPVFCVYCGTSDHMTDSSAGDRCRERIERAQGLR